MAPPPKLSLPIKLGLSAGFLTGLTLYNAIRRNRARAEIDKAGGQQPPNKGNIKPPFWSSSILPVNMAVDHTFQTLFAVPLSCEGCVKSVSDALYQLGGVTKVEGNVKDQLISVEGSAAPSAIVEAIQATGRDAILRGSGASNSAAVSILETYVEKARTAQEGTDREVRGLARMVEVGSGRTLVDLTIRGVSPGTYNASIREYGNLSDGASSTGPVWTGGQTHQPRGILGTVTVDKTGRGSAFVDHGFQVWETIGHAMVLTRQGEEGQPLKNDEDTVVGVIARSAGVWDNDKTVCSCTGKTLWEERKEEVARGMA